MAARRSVHYSLVVFFFFIQRERIKKRNRNKKIKSVVEFCNGFCVRFFSWISRRRKYNNNNIRDESSRLSIETIQMYRHATPQPINVVPHIAAAILPRDVE